MSTAASATRDESDGRPSHVLEPAEIVGTYDVTVTAPPDGTTGVGIGWVADGDEMYVQLTNPPVALQGTLRRDGRLALAGVTTGSDVVLSVSATGRAQARDGVYRIELSIAGPFDVAVIMERPIATDLSAAHGRFRLDFAAPRTSGCECTAAVEVAVPVHPSGSAYLDVTPIAADDGQTIAQLRCALIDVAPSGRFHFEAEYVAADGFDPLGAIGTSSQLQIDGQWPLGSAGAVTTGHYRLRSRLRTEKESHAVTITRIE